MASSRRSLHAAILMLRILTLIILAASLVIIATNKIKSQGDGFDQPHKITFKDAYAYRYVLSVDVIGCAYTLLQIPFAAVSIAQRKRIGGSEGVAMFLIFADVVFSLLLATGAAAGFGLTVDVKHYVDKLFKDSFQSPEISKIHKDYDKFFNLVYVSSGLILAATVCMVIMIIISVYSLTR